MRFFSSLRSFLPSWLLLSLFLAIGFANSALAIGSRSPSIKVTLTNLSPLVNSSGNCLFILVGIRTTDGGLVTLYDDLNCRTLELIGVDVHEEIDDSSRYLVYMQHRYMDLGQFLSEDPSRGSLMAPMGMQGYTYANASPMRFIDPDGRAVNLAAAGIGAIIGGVVGCIGGLFDDDVGCLTGGAIGAGTGALAGLTFGASLAATGAAGIGGTALAAGGTTGSVLVASTTAVIANQSKIGPKVAYPEQYIVGEPGGVARTQVIRAHHVDKRGNIIKTVENQ